MSLSDDATGMIGALGLAALAGALAFGVHMVASPGEPGLDTGDGVDASPTADPGATADPDGGVDTGGTVDDGGDTDTNAGQVAVQLDLSTLGAEISMYYMSWSEGDPQAVITVVGGSYYLSGTELGRASDGVALTGQFARGPGDWCVQLTPTGAPDNHWTYSAQSALAQGTCL